MLGDNGPGADGKDDVVEAFTKVVTALTDGELTFPAPFDLASSAALANNLDAGEIAERLFEVTAQRACGYRVEISEIIPGDPAHPSRQVIKTEVNSLRTLTGLLNGMLDELYARRAE